MGEDSFLTRTLKTVAVMALYLTVGPTLIVTNKTVLRGLQTAAAGTCQPVEISAANATPNHDTALMCHVTDLAATVPGEGAPTAGATAAETAACAGTEFAAGTACAVGVARPFPYPLSVAGLGLLFTSVFSVTVVGAGLVELKPENRELVTRRFYATRILPVGVLTAATMSFGNAVYLHLTVSFIQMLKAFTPAIVMLVLCAMGLGLPTRRQFACVAMITVGTVVSSLSELDLNALGMALMFGAELAEAVRLAMTQFLLKHKKFSIVEGQFLLAPPSCVSILAAAAVLEWPTIAATGDFAILADFWYYFVAAGSLGLLVNFCGFLVIQVSSSIVLKLLGVFRTALFVMVMVVFGGEVVTPREALGYAVSLLFFFLYNYLKMVETDNAAPSPQNEGTAAAAAAAAAVAVTQTSVLLDTHRPEGNAPVGPQGGRAEAGILSDDEEAHAGDTHGEAAALLGHSRAACTSGV